jgi:hypothetical protein
VREANSTPTATAEQAGGRAGHTVRMLTLAFLPWIHVPDPVKLGRFRLVPYERAGTWAEDVHRIVAAYECVPDRPVEKATLVEVDGAVGGDLADSDIEEIFNLRRAVSFAGLRHRRFFRHDGYVNDHTFACVVQNYRPGQKGVGVVARGRDGGRRKLWTMGVRVPCPDHVTGGKIAAVDAELVSALCTAMEGPKGDAMRDAIELLNLANTDSADIRPHTELLLSVASLQRVLGVSKKSKAHELTKSFAEALASIEPERVPSDCRRTIPSKSKAATLRELWFEDFYACRGAVAHGRPVGPPKPIWTLDEHLLLSSYVIPRVALLRLAEDGFRSLTEHDRSEIADFDHLLCPSTLFGPPDPTDDDPEPPDDSQAWTDTLFAAAGERHRRKHAPELERAMAELFELEVAATSNGDR